MRHNNLEINDWSKAIAAFVWLQNNGFSMRFKEPKTSHFFTNRMQVVTFYEKEGNGHSALVFDCKSELDAVLHAIQAGLVRKTIISFDDENPDFDEFSCLHSIAADAHGALKKAIGEKNYKEMLEFVEKQIS